MGSRDIEELLVAIGDGVAKLLYGETSPYDATTIGVLVKRVKERHARKDRDRTIIHSTDTLARLTREHRSLLDFMEACLCAECGGSGRTDNHVTGEVECSSCLGTGHDSQKAFARAERAEATLARVKALSQQWREEVKDRAGSGCGCYGKSTMQRACADQLDAALVDPPTGCEP